MTRKSQWKRSSFLRRKFNGNSIVRLGEGLLEAHDMAKMGKKMVQSFGI